MFANSNIGGPVLSAPEKMQPFFDDDISSLNLPLNDRFLPTNVHRQSPIPQPSIGDTTTPYSPMPSLQTQEGDFRPFSSSSSSSTPSVQSNVLLSTHPINSFVSTTNTKTQTSTFYQQPQNYQQQQNSRSSSIENPFFLQDHRSPQVYAPQPKVHITVPAMTQHTITLNASPTKAFFNSQFSSSQNPFQPNRNLSFKDNKPNTHKRNFSTSSSSSSTSSKSQKSTTRNSSKKQKNDSPPSLAMNVPVPVPSTPTPQHFSTEKPVNELSQPLWIGSKLIVHSLGAIVSGNDKFHTEDYIYPVGYCSYRWYDSPIPDNKCCVHKCEVFNVGNAPEFRIISKDDQDNPIVGSSPEACWKELLKKLPVQKHRPMTGHRFFGFDDPAVIALVQRMPGVNLCKKYKLRNVLLHSSPLQPPAQTYEQFVAQSIASASSQNGNSIARNGFRRTTLNSTKPTNTSLPTNNVPTPIQQNVQQQQQMIPTATVAPSLPVHITLQSPLQQLQHLSQLHQQQLYIQRQQQQQLQQLQQQQAKKKLDYPSTEQLQVPVSEPLCALIQPLPIHHADSWITFDIDERLHGYLQEVIQHCKSKQMIENEQPIQVQLRCSGAVPITSMCFLTINGKVLVPKDTREPININTLCKLGQNVIRVTCTQPHAGFSVHIDLVRCRSALDLLELIKLNPAPSTEQIRDSEILRSNFVEIKHKNSHITMDDFIDQFIVKNSFKTDTQEVEQVSTMISLRCPLTRERMRFPGRSNICNHIQCFDLLNFMKYSLQANNHKWMCPICGQYLPFSTVFLDKFFEEILECVPDSQIAEVEVTCDGNWRIPKQQLDDDYVDLTEDKFLPLDAPVQTLLSEVQSQFTSNEEKYFKENNHELNQTSNSESQNNAEFDAQKFLNLNELMNLQSATAPSAAATSAQTSSTATMNGHSELKDSDSDASSLFQTPPGSGSDDIWDGIEDIPSPGISDAILF